MKYEGRARALGMWGKVLHVDLSTRKTWVEELPQDFCSHYLGGIGIGAKVLWDQMGPNIDPLGPQNILGLLPGDLTDTGALFSGRFTVVAKSPASHSWGDSSCGGFFSPAIKRCGFDALFIRGRSASPIYILVDENGLAVKEAGDLWGLDTIETEDVLKKRHGKRAQAVTIGPGGERLSLMAGVFHSGGRAAARCGLGAVMGSKKVKAVVAYGSLKCPVSDRSRVIRLSREFMQRLKNFEWMEPILNDSILGAVGRVTRPGLFYLRQPSVLWRLLLKKFGTCSLTAMSAENGDSPIKNWAGAGYIDFPLSLSRKIGAGRVTRHEIKKWGCHSCPIRCGGIVRVRTGDDKVMEMHKPEYETICAFGSNLVNSDLSSIFKINDMLNRAGIDTISCGAVVGFAIECFENGLLSASDTDGLELRWGNSAGILTLVEKIIKREGIGNLLADGVKHASEKIGPSSIKYAVHCGGVEAPMHDPKFDPGFLVSYCLQPTPARHTTAAYQYLELQRLEKQFPSLSPVPLITTRKKRFDFTSKARDLALDCFYKMLVDCAGICLFGTQIGGEMPLVEWLNAATGLDLSPEEYIKTGERIFQLRHCFNVREGINPAENFRPHPRLVWASPHKKGPARGIRLDYEKLVNEFYEFMHWDKNTGRPEKEHLERLGLGYVASELYPYEDL